MNFFFISFFFYILTVFAWKSFFLIYYLRPYDIWWITFIYIILFILFKCVFFRKMYFRTFVCISPLTAFKGNCKSIPNFVHTLDKLIQKALENFKGFHSLVRIFNLLTNTLWKWHSILRLVTYGYTNMTKKNKRLVATVAQWLVCQICKSADSVQARVPSPFY